MYQLKVEGGSSVPYLRMTLRTVTVLVGRTSSSTYACPFDWKETAEVVTCSNL